MHMRKFNPMSLFVFVVGLLLGGCNAPKLSVADEQMARGEYFDASRSYRKFYKKLTKRSDRELKGQVAFKMGEAYAKLGQYESAASAFSNALRYGYPDSAAVINMAYMLHGAGKYAEAVKAYERYMSGYKPTPLIENSYKGAKMGVSSGGSGLTRYNVSKRNLFNTTRSEFAPMLNGDALYFTTTSEQVTGTSRSEITGMKRSDIWVSRKNESGVWQRPQALEGEINTEMDEGVASFSPDGMTMYVTVARREPNADTRVAIYTSKRADARWSAPVKLEIEGDSLYDYGHPSVSGDGKYLYFTSNRPGFGDKDIWRINLEKRGVMTPENLGPSINTGGDEMFPYARTDSVLYFASNGHPGYGGLDLFKATLKPLGIWEVENMGRPINSHADDFGITFEPGREAGFFSSGRGDARGYDNIYYFELPDIKISLTGNVSDADEEPIAKAVVRIVGNDGSNQKMITRDDGSFDFTLQRGTSYVMQAGAQGFLNARQSFVSDDAEEDAEYRVDFTLVSLSKPNIVENIFYDYNKATLREESKKALDEVAEMMRENPNITIEMASHTDRVGSDAYNNDLSQRRAKSVVDYLIESGISSDRMSHKGYGKSQPKRVTKRIKRLYPQFDEGIVLTEDYVMTLTPEDREIADQINRRTEFKILSTDYGF